MERHGPQQPQATPAARSVVQLEVRWFGRIVEHLTLGDRARLTRTLVSGHRLTLEHTPSGYTLRCDGAQASLQLGQPHAFDNGLVAKLVEMERAAATTPFTRIDFGWVHAVMLAAALQVGGVAALLLSPPSGAEAGAGYRIEELRRYLRAPAGAAPTRGPGVVIRTGRPAEEAERPVPTPPTRGVSRPVPTIRRAPVEQSLLDAIGALDSVVQGSTPFGADLRETIGDLARSTANAPTQGAGLGGLLQPRELIDTGAGTGVIGVGSDRIQELTKEKRRLDDKRAPPHKSKLKRARLSKAPGTGDGAGAGDDTLDGWGLDPVVRDQLAKAVRRRQSNVRYCYVTWALQADPSRTGRVVLELTLRPDGYVEAPKVKHEDPALGLVAECVERMAGEWYLGHGLVEESTRLAFPFILQPRVQSIQADPHTIHALPPG